MILCLNSYKRARVMHLLSSAFHFSRVYIFVIQAHQSMAEAAHGVILVAGKLLIYMYIAIDSCHVDE